MKKNNKSVVYTILLALLIGVLCGLLSIFFHTTVNFFSEIVVRLYQKLPIYMFIIPLLASLFIGVIRQNLLHKKNQGFSVSQVMFEIEEINLLVMKPLDVFYKIIGTMLSLISGFCVGRLGPLVHIGGAIGSNIANILDENNDDTRVLIGCGVAGSLSGSFDIPIFATIFVVEILFKKRHFNMISTILLSSFSSNLAVKLLRPTNITNLNLHIFEYSQNELIYFLLLGILIGILSIMFTFILRKTNAMFNASKLPFISKGILGGLVISLSLTFMPSIYTYGIRPFDALNDNRSLLLLIITIFTYIILTSVSIGSGSMGGIFTPGLFIGATSGILLSKLIQSLHVDLLDPKAFGLMGMAAMYSGFANAPLSSTLLVIELTGQYNLILPAILATVTSSLVTDYVYKDSIYHLELNDLIKANSN